MLGVKSGQKSRECLLVSEFGTVGSRLSKQSNNIEQDKYPKSTLSIVYPLYISRSSYQPQFFVIYVSDEEIIERIKGKFNCGGSNDNLDDIPINSIQYSNGL